MSRVAILASLTALLASIAVQPAEAAPRVRIDRIYYDSPGGDYGSNRSLNAEWVRLKNLGDRQININGWTVRDTSAHVYRFGRKVLKPGKVVYLHTGAGEDTSAHRYWAQDSYVWNNDGDRATLKNANGSVVDRCGYSGGGSAVNC